MKSAMFTVSMCAVTGSVVWAISGIGLPNAGQAVIAVIVALAQALVAAAYFEGDK